jgi:hypothetical protein
LRAKSDFYDQPQKQFTGIEGSISLLLPNPVKANRYRTEARHSNPLANDGTQPALSVVRSGC